MKNIPTGYTLGKQEVAGLVKGISKQVIVVHSPDEKLFEQAIFIISDRAISAGGITDDALMLEAKKLLNIPKQGKRKKRAYGPVWACGGAAVIGMVWLITVLF